MLGDRAVAEGLRDVSWPARLEVVNRRPLVVLDCAHNVASVAALVDTLGASFPPGRRLLVLGVSNDKDVPGMLRVLRPAFSHFYLTRFKNARSVPPEAMAQELADQGCSDVSMCEDAPAAWQAARAAAGPDDLICITGSVFLAGELRGYAREEAGVATCGAC